MEKIVLNFKILITCLKIKKIKVPKPLIRLIAEISGIKYCFDRTFVLHESPEQIFMGSCTVNNLNLAKQILPEIQNKKLALLICGYYGLTEFLKCISDENKDELFLRGRVYSKGIVYLYKKLENKFTPNVRFHNYFRAICHHQIYVEIDYKGRKMTHTFNDILNKIYRNCDSCDINLKCNSCLTALNEGLYGSCESGQLWNTMLLVDSGATGLNKGLYLSKKYGHPEISNFLINAGAKNVKYILKSECDIFYEMITKN